MLSVTQSNSVPLCVTPCHSEPLSAAQRRTATVQYSTEPHRTETAQHSTHAAILRRVCEWGSAFFFQEQPEQKGGVTLPCQGREIHKVNYTEIATQRWPGRKVSGAGRFALVPVDSAEVRLFRQRIDAQLQVLDWLRVGIVDLDKPVPQPVKRKFIRDLGYE